MTRQRFVIAASVVGLVVLTLALFVSSLASIRNVRIDSFQRTADPQKIVVHVVIGLGDELAERSVDEDERSVKVTVRVRQPPGPSLLLGIQVPVLVTLKQPLKARVVLDYDGSPVRDLGQYFAPGSTPRP